MSKAQVSVAELSKHALPDDCWVLVNGKCFDLTRFAPEHPGGPDSERTTLSGIIKADWRPVIYKYAGRDGSAVYNEYHGADLIEKTLKDEEKKGDFDESTVTETWRKAQQVETISHPDPNEKPPLSTIINLEDFELAFERTASAKAQAYTAGASNDLLTLHANKQYWQKLWFRPRVMRDVSKVKTRTRMLGVGVSMPVWICPMGIAKTAGPDAETALARGAATGDIVHCISTSSSLTTEEIIAAGNGHPCFFQLYVDKQRHKTEALLKRLQKMPQIKAIFVTADLPVVSKREADERIRTQEVVSAYADNRKSSIDSKGGGLARSTGSFIDPALSWQDVSWVKKHTHLPVLVKGIQSAADARMAYQSGCDGIVISNHGGRALDGAPATILVLLELRRDCPEIFRKMQVHIDGGVRRGSDVLKAILLGAHGVGVGRPYQCAISYGPEGVDHCTSILKDELETAMRLCGLTDLAGARGDTSWLNMSELERFLPARSNSDSFFGRFFRPRL